jgi:hypothetical protein
VSRIVVAVAVLFLLQVASLRAQTITVPVVIERTADMMVIYFAGNQPIALDNFTMTFDQDGVQRPPVALADYPAFLPLDNVATPRCFVIRTFQTQTPVLQTCAQLASNQIVTYSLSPGGVFWFDTAFIRQRNLQIGDGTQIVAVCQSETNPCAFDFPARPANNVVPTSAPLPQGLCVITETMNLLTSPDRDNDGLSDFEELCILQTDPLQPDRDSDGDGVIDALELVFAGNNPAWANPSIANEDSDGDWLFDRIELEFNLDPDEVDTDGDLLSDFLEFYWLGTDRNAADRDDDFDGFPDVLEVYLPPSFDDFIPCRVEVAPVITRIYVADREEDNDPQEMIPGDEARISYLLRDLTGNGGTQQRTWARDGIMSGDTFVDIQQLSPIIVACGATIEFMVSAIESDAPFGGSEQLGEETITIDVLFQRIPIAHHLGSEQIIQFTGTSEDGFYDYQIFYRVDVRALTS